MVSDLGHLGHLGHAGQYIYLGGKLPTKITQVVDS